MRADPADAVIVRAEARAAAAKAARAHLDQIASDGGAPEPALASLRASLDRKARRYQQLLDRLETVEDDDEAGPPSPPGYEAAVQAAVRSSTRSARSCCAGATPATCPTPACASWSASSTTRNARSPRTTTADRPAHPWRGSAADPAKGNAMVKTDRPLAAPTVR